MEKLKLNIQRFADEGTTITDEGNTNVDTSKSDEGNSAVKNDLSFTELLKNPEYQREFDKLVNKSINTAKTNWEKDYNARLEAEKTEAEKLAKMDADQKIQYELEKATKEKEDLQNQLNAINLYKTASEIATEKELPIGYLDLVDFSRETAETITAKIDKLQELRTKDLQNYLNSKMKQATPQEKKDDDQTYDPYIEGFKSEY